MQNSGAASVAVACRPERDATAPPSDRKTAGAMGLPETAKGIPRRDTEEIAESRISRGRMRAILRFYTTCTFLSEFEIMWETGEVDFEPITTRV